MNLKEAIKILRREGYSVEKVEGGYFVDYATLPRWVESPMSASDVVKQARRFTSDSQHNTGNKKPLKKFNDKKNRAATRDMIKNEDWDDMPTDKGQIKYDDPWNWD